MVKKNYKVVRILVYKGTEEWADTTLAKGAVQDSVITSNGDIFSYIVFKGKYITWRIKLFMWLAGTILIYKKTPKV